MLRAYEIWRAVTDLAASMQSSEPFCCLQYIRKSLVEVLCRFWYHDILKSLAPREGKLTLFIACSSPEISFSIAWSASSTSELLPPYTLFITLLARWLLSFFNKPSRRFRAMTTSVQIAAQSAAAPNPTIHLHLCAFNKHIHPMAYATTCPKIINKTIKVTSPPRKSRRRKLRDTQRHHQTSGPEDQTDDTPSPQSSPIQLIVTACQRALATKENIGHDKHPDSNQLYLQECRQRNWRRGRKGLVQEVIRLL